VDLAAAEAERIGDVDVGALRVRIGDRPMSAIVHDACRFSFNVAALVTPVEGARHDIQLGSDDEPASPHSSFKIVRPRLHSLFNSGSTPRRVLTDMPRSRYQHDSSA
jgi:hypothetical protein